MNCLVILMNRTFPLEYFCEKHHNSMLFYRSITLLAITFHPVMDLLSVNVLQKMNSFYTGKNLLERQYTRVVEFVCEG